MNIVARCEPLAPRMNDKPETRDRVGDALGLAGGLFGAGHDFLGALQRGGVGKLDRRRTDILGPGMGMKPRGILPKLQTVR